MTDEIEDATDAKTTARTAAFAARKLAHARAVSEAESGAGVESGGVEPAATTHLLASMAGVRPGQVVAGYMPIRTEIDPRPAMAVLHAMGIRVCVPVIAAAGLPLGFRAWHPGCAMVAGPFGAQVPEGGCWLTPAHLIVPLVAFDAVLNRLGYGGGFYDRTLEVLRAAAPTRAVGFAYAAQQLPHVPQEPTDQPLDLIVTETGALAAPRARA